MTSDVLRFDKKLIDKVFERKQIITQYRKALENEEFVVYYQPKVDTDGGRLCGGEALVRWQKGDKLIPPFSFIPVLESEGSIVELDYYVFDKVCANLREWQDSGIEPVMISSNFSKLHLREHDFAEKIIAIADRHNVPHDLIEIEVTESSGYESINELTKFVQKMNEAGISVSVDDFGTGYSSLSMLKNLNVNVIKLDKSLIDGIGSGDIVNEKLVANVIRMIKDLNRSIVCEGVEEMRQAEFLKEQECFCIQGYLFDKPLPRPEFEERLKKPEYKT